MNFSQVRAFDRDKILEATIRRDFQEVLAITEKNMNKKAYAKVEEARQMFPRLMTISEVKAKKLDQILAECSCFAHAFLFDEDGMTIRSQPSGDKYVREEHEHIAESYKEWLSTASMEVKEWVGGLHKKKQHIVFSPMQTKRVDGPAYLQHRAVRLAGRRQEPNCRRRSVIRSMLPEKRFLSSRAVRADQREVGRRRW